MKCSKLWSGRWLNDDANVLEAKEAREARVRREIPAVFAVAAKIPVIRIIADSLVTTAACLWKAAGEYE